MKNLSEKTRVEDEEAKRLKEIEKTKKMKEKLETEEKIVEEAIELKEKTLDELMAEDDKVTEINIPILKTKIRIKQINAEDYTHLTKWKNQNTEEAKMNYTVEYIARTWGKCDPTVTVQKLKKMRLVTLLKIISCFPGTALVSPLSKKGLKSRREAPKVEPSSS